MFRALGKIVDIDQELQRAEDAALRNANLNCSQCRLHVTNSSQLKAIAEIRSKRSSYIIRSTNLLELCEQEVVIDNFFFHITHY